MGRADEAAVVMGIMYDCDPQDEEVQKEIRDMQLSMELNGSVSLMQMFKMGKHSGYKQACLPPTNLVRSSTHFPQSLSSWSHSDLLADDWNQRRYLLLDHSVLQAIGIQLHPIIRSLRLPPIYAYHWILDLRLYC